MHLVSESVCTNQTLFGTTGYTKHGVGGVDERSIRRMTGVGTRAVERKKCHFLSQPAGVRRRFANRCVAAVRVRTGVQEEKRAHGEDRHRPAPAP